MIAGVRNLLEGTRPRALIISISLIAYFAVLIRTAWITDDAYITFRVIDNLASGYGPVWNVGERVQAYTHPLWLAIISAGVLFTNEFYFTVLTISIVLAFGAVALLTTRLSQTSSAALLAVLILTFSRAFVDYSTSGLENPLTFFLLAIFALLYFRLDFSSPINLFQLSLVACAGVLTRFDNSLLFLPPLAYAFWIGRSWRSLAAVILGFTPFLMWELFSLFYYGFPLPNTAYAKIGRGIPLNEFVRKGGFYFLESLLADPITLIAVATGLGAAYLSKDRKQIPLAIGIVLYLLYILRIGGGFMSGRFFAAPLFVAIVLLARSRIEKRIATLLIIAFALLGFVSPKPTVFSNADYRLHRDVKGNIANYGITDERGVYYPGTGLLRYSNSDEFPIHGGAVRGSIAREQGLDVVTAGVIGFLGFYSGPEVHIIDKYGLADPLIARLPIRPTINWRIGHLKASIPDGYVASVDHGHNHIDNKDLAVYYEKIQLITRGELFDPLRLREVLKFNLGLYDSYIPLYVASLPENVVVNELEKSPSELLIGPNGFEIVMDSSVNFKCIEIELTNNQDFQIFYKLDGEIVGQALFYTNSSSETLMSEYLILVPQDIMDDGYDRVLIIPSSEITFSVGAINFR